MATNEQKKERMKELVKILSEASYAYYAKDEEIISNLFDDNNSHYGVLFRWV